MTNAKPAVSEVSAADATEHRPGEVRPFLAAIATVLHETVTAFESSVNKITEITVTRPGRADRDLVVALQDFDRLQQEFATLGNVIARLSLNATGPQAEAEALAAISIADLKERLACQLRKLTMDLPAGDTAEDIVF